MPVNTPLSGRLILVKFQRLVFLLVFFCGMWSHAEAANLPSFSPNRECPAPEKWPSNLEPRPLNCPPGNVLYVNAAATGNNDGTSWVDAYTDLQDALADTCSDIEEIWVAAGTYYPSSVNDPSESFVMKNNLGIYGGFNGTETVRSQRDWVLNVTILSGDIGVQGDSTDNTERIINNDNNNLDSTAILDGFTITDALKNGMYNEYASPTVKNCLFFENTGSNGSGMYNRYASPLVSYCSFTGNTGGFGAGMSNINASTSVSHCSFTGNTGINGCGIYNQFSSPVISNCSFTDNVPISIAFPSQGGGIHNFNSSPVISNCLFESNEAQIGGGMMNISNTVLPTYPTITNCSFLVNTAIFSGGGIANVNASPNIADCIFFGNTAEINGGGISHSDSTLTVTDCSFIANISLSRGGAIDLGNSEDNIAISNCLFSGNSAAENGGAIDIALSSVTLQNCSFSGNTAINESGGGLNLDGSNVTLQNCSFNANEAGEWGGAIYNFDTSTLIATNCIFWGDTAVFGGNEIATFFSDDPIITHSIVEGGFTGAGNLDLDPLFAGDTLRLQACSPAIDAGDNSANSTAEDLDLNPRLRDGNGNGTLTIDMGAYEYQDTVSNCACPDKIVMLTDPMDGDINVPVNTDLHWATPLNEPLGYKIRVDTVSGGSSIVNNFDVGSDTTYDLPANLPAGDVIYVTIIPYYIDGDATGCLEESFTTAGGGGGGAVPGCTSLTNPVNGATGVSVNTSLNWAAAAGNPSGYKLRLGTAPGGGDILNNFNVGNVTSYTPANPLPFYSIIYVTVTPYNASGDAAGCLEESFTTEGFSPGGCQPGYILFVNENATGDDNGSSWADAFTDLQDAIVYANVCLGKTEIWVAEGTYKPTDNTDRTLSFSMKSNLSILGGFPGTGSPGMNDRDWNAFETILSGDLGVQGDTSDNSYHVIFNDNNWLDSTAVLDGFTIANGNASGSGDGEWGGGMFNNGVSPSILNCKFSNNSAAVLGAGVYNNFASPTFSNCSFIGNASASTGGMYNFNGSSPVLTNCSFIGNSGSAMFNGASSSIVLTNCLFMGNSATVGAGLFNSSASVVVTNCSFSGNSGTLGSVMYNFSSSPVFTNCIVWGNSSSVIFNNSGSNPVVTHSIVENGYVGAGNLDEDPLFINQPPIGLGTTGDLRLQDCSPATDAGENNANATTLDLDGNPRFVNATIDMGAYEFQSATGNCGCTPNLVVTGNPIPAGTYASTGQLTSSNSSVAAGTAVIFISDTGILLPENFEVILGGVFEAVIEACGN